MADKAIDLCPREYRSPELRHAWRLGMFRYHARLSSNDCPYSEYREPEECRAWRAGTRGETSPNG